MSDPFSEKGGAHDYRAIAGRPDVATFESLPLEADLRVVGPVQAVIFLSADAPDTDLWVKLYDVSPDGTAFNLMSPGLDVLRASFRNGSPEPLETGQVYELRLESLFTGNQFKTGTPASGLLEHRLPSSFFAESAHRTVRDDVFGNAQGHDHHPRWPHTPSRLVLPVVP